MEEKQDNKEGIKIGQIVLSLSHHVCPGSGNGNSSCRGLIPGGVGTGPICLPHRGSHQSAFLSAFFNITMSSWGRGYEENSLQSPRWSAPLSTLECWGFWKALALAGLIARKNGSGSTQEAALMKQQHRYHPW